MSSELDEEWLILDALCLLGDVTGDLICVEVGLELMPVVASDCPQLSVDVSSQEELLVVAGSDSLNLSIGHLLGVVLDVVTNVEVILDLNVEGVVDLLFLVGVPLVTELYKK